MIDLIIPTYESKANLHKPFLYSDEKMQSTSGCDCVMTAQSLQISNKFALVSDQELAPEAIRVFVGRKRQSGRGS